jgi:hypothetical protein
MKKRVELIIASMKNSPRLPRLIRRLKKFNLKYKIFYGFYGNKQSEVNKVYSHYDKKKVVNRIGRELGFNEMSGNYLTIRMYKYAQKKKLDNIICMTDDAYPSFLFKEWIDKKICFTGSKIIGLQCYSSGFLKKKNESVLSGKVKIHQAKTHLFNSNCYQITSDAIKNIFSVSKGKIVGNGDWPINFKKNNIKMFQTLPFLIFPDDKGFSFINKDRIKLEKTLFKDFKKFFYKFFGTKFANKILNFLRIPYYVLFIPFLFRKYKNFDYYVEYYFEKYFLKLVNPIFNFYIDVENICYLKSSYPRDLKKFAKYRVFDN